MESPKRKVNAFWHDDLLPHLAADVFPLLPSDELGELGADIEKNRLTVPIVLWRVAPDAPLQVLDGRNRLDALARKFGPVCIVCEPIKESGRTVTMVWSIKAGEDWIADEKVIVLDSSIDPIAYVVSINMRRRHLTPEQRREVIANLIKLQPEKSNRQLGKLIKVDHKTVGAVRAQKESTGEVSPVAKRVGADGRSRKQPAKRKTAIKQQTRDTRADIGADIGPASTGETEVPPTVETSAPTAREGIIDDLRAQVRQRDIKITGLESEVEELQSQLEQRQKLARWLVHQLGAAKVQIEELKTEYRFHDVTGKPFLATIVELDLPVVWTAEEIIADIDHPNLTPEHLRRATELLHYIADALVARRAKPPVIERGDNALPESDDGIPAFQGRRVAR